MGAQAPRVPSAPCPLPPVLSSLCPPGGGSSLSTPAPAAGPACERRLLLQDAYGSSLALAHPSSGPVTPSQAPGCPQTPSSPAWLSAWTTRSPRASRREADVQGQTHTRERSGPQAPGPPTVPASAAGGLCRVAIPVSSLLLAFARCPGAGVREGPGHRLSSRCLQANAGHAVRARVSLKGRPDAPTSRVPGVRLPLAQGAP